MSEHEPTPELAEAWSEVSEHCPNCGNPFAWTVFTAAVLSNGPITVKADARRAVFRQSMSIALHQEVDAETGDVTYTLPEARISEARPAWVLDERELRDAVRARLIDERKRRGPQ